MKRDSWGYLLMIVSSIIVTVCPYAHINQPALGIIALLTLPVFFLGLIFAFPNPRLTAELIGVVCLLCMGRLIYLQKITVEELREKNSQLEKSLKDCDSSACDIENDFYDHSTCTGLKAPLTL